MIIKLTLKSYFMICIIFGAETGCGCANTNILSVLGVHKALFCNFGDHIIVEPKIKCVLTAYLNQNNNRLIL